jgi:hypothetical protein
MTNSQSLIGQMPTQGGDPFQWPTHFKDSVLLPQVPALADNWPDRLMNPKYPTTGATVFSTMH